MLWQLFPIYTVGVIGGLTLIYLFALCIEHFDCYYGIDQRKKRKFVFWGLKILEFTALTFVIEMTISLMKFGTAGGFFHTTAKIVFSVLISTILLFLIAFVVFLILWIGKGLGFLINKMRKDLLGDIKRILGNIVDSVVGLWNMFIQANKDYAEVIADKGIIHSMVNIDMLKWEVSFMRANKVGEERERKREREEMSKRTRQAEKELSDAMAIAEGRKIKLWYPLGGNDEV